jgi:Glycosyltransferase family 87
MIAMRPQHRSSSDDKRATILLAAVIAIVFAFWIAIFIIFIQLGHGIGDFPCFYSAGKMIVSGNSSRIYDYEAQKQAQHVFFAGLTPPALQFVFIPYILVIFAPLALLSYPHAFMLWYFMNITMVTAVPFLLADRLGMQKKQIGVALLCLAGFSPIILSLLRGQPTILTLLIFTLAFLDLENDRDFRAGCTLALALYKPQFVIPLVLALAITRNWKALRGFFVTSLLLFAVSVSLVGWNTTLQFPRAVIAFGKLPAKMAGERVEWMTNLRGLLQWLLDSRLSQDRVLLIAGTASALLSLGILLTALARKRRISQLEFSLVILVTVLSSYHSYEHDMALLVLPLILVTQYAVEHDFTPIVLAMSAGLVYITSSSAAPVSVGAMLLFCGALFIETMRTRAFVESPNVAGQQQQCERPASS